MNLGLVKRLVPGASLRSSPGHPGRSTGLGRQFVYKFSGSRLAAAWRSIAWLRVAATAGRVGAWCALLCAAGNVAADEPLPEAQPVPRVQVLPLPYDQASFQVAGHELTQYHFGAALRRPFCYPIRGPGGRSLTRMGHPHDPVSHSHHNSVWISHASVAGVDFWTDHGKDAGRIVCRAVERYEDGDQRAWLEGVNQWQDSSGRVLLVERRRVEVRPIDAGQWWLVLDVELSPPGNEPVVLGQTPFGLIGLRMAKTIGVRDGGGRIRNSEGGVNEAGVFRKPARWVDYSGPLSQAERGGITLMDHPANADHPTPFHVRDDGWMGVCLTLRGERRIEPGERLHVRYGLWNHTDVPDASAIEARWREFREFELP